MLSINIQSRKEKLLPCNIGCIIGMDDMDVIYY